MSATLASIHANSAIGSLVRTNSTTDITDNDEQSQFSREELLQFAADDSNAGRHVGAILASIFIYTVIAMSIAGWWTYRSVGH